MTILSLASSIDAQPMTRKSLGKVLLLDADSYCYAVSYNTAKLSTALKNYEIAVRTIMELAQCATAEIHITPEGNNKCGRHFLKTVKPYQANRANIKKSPLVGLLRAEIPNYFKDAPDITVVASMDYEADDTLMIASFKNPTGTTLCSADKDLLICPHPSYDENEDKHLVLPNGDTYGYIYRKKWLTPSGGASSKVIGKGSKFFLAQMLMGDTADNVKGLITLNGKSIGEAGTFAYLDPIKDPDEAVNAVIDGYRAIEQNVIAEGQALWLLRNEDDHVYKFFSEHNLTEVNKDFLNVCMENYKHDQA